MAEKHWREFCPKMVQQLETEGRLMEALWEAQETTLDEMETLTRKLETGAEADAAAGAGDGVGVDPGEVYSPAARREPERLNARNYRIRAGGPARRGFAEAEGRDNFAAIELVQTARRRRPRGDRRGEARAREICRLGRHPAGLRVTRSRRNGKPERERLKALLTPEEYEAARASTLNAHYTSPTVISGDLRRRWSGSASSGGRVLEPALGIGHFFGLMPEEMSARSRLTGIELDPLTASIARQLYPDADIRAQGFESARAGRGSFDLAISNVPFGDYKVHRSAVRRAQFSRPRLLLRERDGEGAAGRADGLHHVEGHAR